MKRTARSILRCAQNRHVKSEWSSVRRFRRFSKKLFHVVFQGRNTRTPVCNDCAPKISEWWMINLRAVKVLRCAHLRCKRFSDYECRNHCWRWPVQLTMRTKSAKLWSCETFLVKWNMTNLAFGKYGNRKHDAQKQWKLHRWTWKHCFCNSIEANGVCLEIILTNCMEYWYYTWLRSNIISKCIWNDTSFCIILPEIV